MYMRFQRIVFRCPLSVALGLPNATIPSAPRGLGNQRLKVSRMSDAPRLDIKFFGTQIHAHGFSGIVGTIVIVGLILAGYFLCRVF